MAAGQIFRLQSDDFDERDPLFGIFMDFSGHRPVDEITLISGGLVCDKKAWDL
jgi:hypothetical protein